MVTTASVVRTTPSSSGLYDVLDLILDKGLVIDAYVRVSVIGIELLTVDLRVVVASVDTYLRFAEAVDRLNLQAQGGADLTDLVGDGKGADRSQERTALGRGAREAGGGVRDALGRVREKVTSGDQEDRSGEEEHAEGRQAQEDDRQAQQEEQGREER